MSRSIAAFGATVFAHACFAAAADADPIADFYRGRQIQMVIRTAPGGDYDQYSRLLARFLGRHIPGHPTFVATNMPGGGGIVAANYMAKVAPRDGSVMGIVSQGLILDQALGINKQLQADFRAFNWIANVIASNQLLVVWHTSATKTLDDAKRRETLIGTTGAGSASVQYPAFYNAVIGTRFKLVTGYVGGQEIDLAMERGELEGRGTNPYSGYMASKPEWMAQRKIIPLVQAGMTKDPALPDVPLIVELPVMPEDRPLLELMGRASDVGRPLATTPGTPVERVAALRAAFARTIEDVEFKAAAARESMAIRPMTGVELAAHIEGILGAPDVVRARLKLALEPRQLETRAADGVK